MDYIKLLEEKAKLHPDKPAIIYKEGQITFLQLRDNVFSFASSLKKLGVERGTKVAIYLPSCPEYYYSYLAVWFLGATAVPLDYMLTQDELVSCMTHAEVKVLIARPKPILSLEILKEKCRQLESIILALGDKALPEKAGFYSIEGLISSGSTEVYPRRIVPNDYAIIFYTSGTTGKPKGVLINYIQLGAPPMSMDFFADLRPSDIALCALPFSHLGGLIYIQNNIVFGLTVVLMERFIPVEFLKNIQFYHVNCFWIVPSMYYAFLQLKEFESFDLPACVGWLLSAPQVHPMP